jgi:hypothetical protein
MIPEKLNLWDRFFNRYTEILVKVAYEKRHVEYWHDTTSVGVDIPEHDYYIKWGTFKKIDRLTGSETMFVKAI